MKKNKRLFALIISLLLMFNLIPANAEEVMSLETETTSEMLSEYSSAPELETNLDINAEEIQPEIIFEQETELPAEIIEIETENASTAEVDVEPAQNTSQEETSANNDNVITIIPETEGLTELSTEIKNEESESDTTSISDYYDDDTFFDVSYDQESEAVSSELLVDPDFETSSSEEALEDNSATQEEYDPLFEDDEEFETETETEFVWENITDFSIEPDFESSSPTGIASDSSGTLSESSYSPRRLRSSRAGGFSENYGDQLTVGEREIYDGIVSNWSNGDFSRFTVSFSEPLVSILPGEMSAEEAASYITNKQYTSDEWYLNFRDEIRRRIQGGCDAFAYDNPEAFWFSSVQYGVISPQAYMDKSGNIYGKMTGVVLLSPNEAWEGALQEFSKFQSDVDNAVNDIAASVNSASTTAQKVKVIAEYICSKCDYVIDTQSYSAYGVLSRSPGAACCEGYSKALKILCNRFGIPCVLVPGDAITDRFGTTEAHMWTYIKIDGVWYFVDNTWMDSSNGVSYDWFMIGQNSKAGYYTIAEQRKPYSTFSTGLYSREFSNPTLSQEAYYEWEVFDYDEETCTESGRYLYQNAIRPSEMREEETTPLGHEMGEWEIITKASCTQSGLKKRSCIRCEHYEEEVIPTAEHQYQWVTKTPSTCKDEGLEEYKCSICEHVSETRTISKASHSFSEWSVILAPTCAKDGTERRVCSECGYAEERAVSKTGQHNYKWTRTVEPTCEKDGKEEYKCTVCGDVTNSRVISKTGHSYKLFSTQKKVTCTQPGAETQICTKCGHLEERTIPTLGHKYVWVKALNPTCEKDGREDYKCSTCGYVSKTRVISKTGHQYGKWVIVKNATVKEEGLRKKTCSVCGHTVTEKMAKKKCTHSYGAWTVTKAATVFQTGKKTRKCSVCGAVQEATISTIKPFVTIKNKDIEIIEKNKTTISVKLAKGDSIVSYKSSNSKIASVSKKGQITAKAMGKCSITVKTKSGLSSKINVSVVKKVKKVNVKTNNKTVSTIKLKVKKSVKLKVYTTPAKTGYKVTYVSSNNKIATVSSSGKITAKKKGTCYITVKIGGKSKKIKVICS